ncbi:MAG: hypothetical protein Q8O74_09240 [bacterium]|nr:hypothetical protein [bacterium]
MHGHLSLFFYLQPAGINQQPSGVKHLLQVIVALGLPEYGIAFIQPLPVHIEIIPKHPPGHGGIF